MSTLTTKQIDYSILGSLAVVSAAAAKDAIEQHHIDHSLFEAPGAAEVFGAMQNLILAGERIHIVRLAAVVPHSVQRVLGGPDILAKMCSPNAMDKAQPLPLLVDHARRRQGLKRARLFLEEGMAALLREDLEGARQSAQKLIEAPTTTQSDEVFHVSEVSTRIRVKAEGRMAGTSPEEHVSTGIPALDKNLRGGFPRNLVVIGAEGGRGKSGLAIRMAEEAARAGVGAGYITLEDAAETLLSRLVDDHPSVNVGPALFHATTEARHLNNLHIALADLSTLPLWMTRHGRVSPRKLLSLADAMRHRGAGIVFIDNSNEMLFDSPDERHRAMDDVLQQLREWAIRWGVPVVFITHLTRDARRTDADPIKRGDFAHSAGFERIARCMLGVRQLNDGQVMAIDCVKLNEGPPGRITFLQMSSKAGVPTLFEAIPPTKNAQGSPRSSRVFGTQHAD
jgi:replicative DNA helicase